MNESLKQYIADRAKADLEHIKYSGERSWSKEAALYTAQVSLATIWSCELDSGACRHAN